MDDERILINRRILVIDDTHSIHADFRKVLSGGLDHAPGALLAAAELALLGETAPVSAQPTFELESALQGQAGVARVREALENGRPYAMAFVDMRMPPGWDGLETIERLWDVDPDVQVVICSAHSDHDWADVVARLNYSDKLLVVRKPFEPIEVLQCANALTRKWHNERIVRRHVAALERTLTTRTLGLEEANQQMRHLATHDALTGLPNRLLMDDRLGQACAHAARQGSAFAVVLLDLDRFKHINESLGHRAGDELLQEVARRLSAVAGDVHTVARLGGDEFVLIVDPASPDDARRLATQIIESLQAPAQVGGVSIHTSPSIGIALFPADGTSIERLLAHADAAMYSAKQRGRNNLQFFVAGMDASSQARVRLESDLRVALERQQLALHYQPKVNTHTGLVHGAEALLRWQHPERGMISPAEFIPVAEECGLIASIGTWVMNEACRQARAWQLVGLPPLRIAVNLSASQFRQGNIIDMIREALAGAELDPRLLEVELTESAVMSDPEDSARILEQLSQMGVLVSVDDFGTGYSSMSYLRRFPIDKLKIDKSFVNDVLTSPEAASIVSAIVSLAHSLKLKVVAEGIETAGQLEFLKSLGCDQYQGYYFSRAVPAAQFEALIRANHGADAGLSDFDAHRTHSKLAAYRPVDRRRTPG